MSERRKTLNPAPSLGFTIPQTANGLGRAAALALLGAVFALTLAACDAPPEPEGPPDSEGGLASPTALAAAAPSPMPALVVAEAPSPTASASLFIPTDTLTPDTPSPTATPAPTPSPALIREALTAFYNATNGDDWTNSDNWLTDAPIRETGAGSACGGGEMVKTWDCIYPTTD